MITYLIFFILSAIIAAEAGYIGYLLGANKILRRFLVSTTRDKKEFAKNNELLLNKCVQRSGLGTLAPRKESYKPARSTNVIAPSQVIEQLHKEAPLEPVIQSHPVPPHTKQAFLSEFKNGNSN